MMPVLVFTTSVQSVLQVKQLEEKLNGIAGRGNWNFALDDCDKILRISSTKVSAQSAIRMLQEHGYACAELDE